MAPYRRQHQRHLPRGFDKKKCVLNKHLFFPTCYLIGICHNISKWHLLPVGHVHQLGLVIWFRFLMNFGFDVRKKSAMNLHFTDSWCMPISRWFIECMKILSYFGPKTFIIRFTMRNANFEELNNRNGVVSAWVHGAPRGVPRWHINQSGSV